MGRSRLSAYNGRVNGSGHFWKFPEGSPSSSSLRKSRPREKSFRGKGEADQSVFPRKRSQKVMHETCRGLG